MIKKFTVGGMSCSNCALGIEKAVGRLNGVSSVRVALMDKSMTVSYDEGAVSEEQIISTVIKLGYTAKPYMTKKADGIAPKNDDANKLKHRFLVSIIFLLPLMYFSMGGMLGLPVPPHKINLIIQAVLAIILIVINRAFYINGTRAVLHGTANMDTLVALGSVSAYIYSLVTLVLAWCKNSQSHAFFEASAMVLTLVTLGKWLEELSKKRTGEEVEKLSRLIPDEATIRVDGADKTVKLSSVVKGDILVFKAGEYLSVDGVIIEGSAGMDKSAITGESMPVEAAVGDYVTSGSIVRSGFILVRAEKVGEDTLFSGIVKIVKEAGVSRAPFQKLADKVAGVFVPVVTAIALIGFVAWLLISGNLYLAFNFGISVLVISCPCALGLATPVAVMAATGKAASLGILFKDAEALQKACKINCVLLDKTATLTVGKPVVTVYKNYSNVSDSEVFAIVSAMEAKSSHPLAEPLIEYCGLSNFILDSFEYETGKGIIAKIDGANWTLGLLVC